MRDPAERLDLEPINAAMAQADAIDVQRLRDDDEIGAIVVNVTLRGEVCHPGESAAFFVDRPALFDAPMEAHSRTANCFDCVNRGHDARFLVGSASAVDLAVAEGARVRIDAPALARGHHVEVPIEMQ